MTADTKHADLLRRLANEAVRELEPSGIDPVIMLVREFERIWRLGAACTRDDLGGLIGDVEEVAAGLGQQIVDTVATSKMGLICQARLAQHENFPDYLLDDLLNAVHHGIVDLVPNDVDRRACNNATATGGGEVQP
jgi:hypothetical protein